MAATGSANQVWYVAIPFASEASAERAMREITNKTGYLASILNSIEGDPPSTENHGDCRDVGGCSPSCPWAPSGAV